VRDFLHFEIVEQESKNPAIVTRQAAQQEPDDIAGAYAFRLAVIDAENLLLPPERVTRLIAAGLFQRGQHLILAAFMRVDAVPLAQVVLKAKRTVLDVPALGLPRTPQPLKPQAEARLLHQVLSQFRVRGQVADDVFEASAYGRILG